MGLTVIGGDGDEGAAAGGGGGHDARGVELEGAGTDHGDAGTLSQGDHCETEEKEDEEENERKTTIDGGKSAERCVGSACSERTCEKNIALPPRRMEPV